jgi:hypothetical protein
MVYLSSSMTKFICEEVEKHIKRRHSGCPDFAVTYFARKIAKRDWKKAFLGQAVGITMQTFLRHEMTEYDTLLLCGVDREDARRRVQPKINKMISCWRRKRKKKRGRGKVDDHG